MMEVTRFFGETGMAMTVTVAVAEVPKYHELMWPALKAVDESAADPSFPARSSEGSNGHRGNQDLPRRRPSLRGVGGPTWRLRPDQATRRRIHAPRLEVHAPRERQDRPALDAQAKEMGGASRNPRGVDRAGDGPQAAALRDVRVIPSRRASRESRY